MKNKAFILTILAVSMVFQLSATVWRVNNRVILGQTVSADFTTLQAAIDDVNVLANDTLYLAGSPTAYGDGTFNKPLVVIGTGYFLTDNDTTQAYQNQSQVGKLTLSAGSEGSVVMGLYIYYSLGASSVTSVYIGTDNITLKKNRIYAYCTWNQQYTGTYAIIVAAGIQQINIMQNFISTQVSGDLTSVAQGVRIGDGAKCVINNNIFRNVNPQATKRYAINTEDNSLNDIYITNNVFYNYNILTFYSTHLNNILINGTYNNGTGDNTANNLCSVTQYPSLYNQQNIDMSTVFVNYTSAVDNGYLLKAGSPAIATGYNGGDCGAFSNDTGYSYVLSGLPGIPAIFSFTIDNTIGVNQLSAHIKAISHNESK